MPRGKRNIAGEGLEFIRIRISAMVRARSTDHIFDDAVRGCRREQRTRDPPTGPSNVVVRRDQSSQNGTEADGGIDLGLPHVTKDGGDIILRFGPMALGVIPNRRVQKTACYHDASDCRGLVPLHRVWLTAGTPTTRFRSREPRGDGRNPRFESWNCPRHLSDQRHGRKGDRQTPSDQVAHRGGNLVPSWPARFPYLFAEPIDASHHPNPPESHRQPRLSRLQSGAPRGRSGRSGFGRYGRELSTRGG